MQRRKKQNQSRVLDNTLIIVFLIIGIVLVVFAVIKYIDNIISIYEDPNGYYFGIGMVIAIIIGVFSVFLEMYLDEKDRKGR